MQNILFDTIPAFMLVMKPLPRTARMKSLFPVNWQKQLPGL